MIPLKAFIYRLSCIFGLRIHLAKKEEDAYIRSLGDIDPLEEKLARGSWLGFNGFTSVWTYRMPFYKAMKAKIRHAFTFGKFQ